MAYFMVTTVHGPAWDASRPIREQRAWDEHAAFMDDLVDVGFVYLGGPLADGERALLIIDATSEEEIGARMAEDPWAPMGLLRLGDIQRWSVWLDGRQSDGPVSTGAVR